MLAPPAPTPAPNDDPVSAVLTNRDLVHEILVRVHGGRPWPAAHRAAVRTLGPAWADAAGRLPVSLDAAEPAAWALARHGSEADVLAALAGLVELRVGGGGGGCARAATLAAARLLRCAPAPATASLSSVSAAHLTTPWLARALEGRTAPPLSHLDVCGFWHRPAAGARLPACGAGHLTLTQLPGGGVGAGKGALAPHPALLARVASARRLTLVGLGGLVLEAAPPDLAELELERVPVRLEAGRPSPPAVSLPPGHGRLARLSLAFEKEDGFRRKPSVAGAPPTPRPAVVDLLSLAAGAEALALAAPGRGVRARLPARFLPGGPAAPADVAAALRAALVESGVGSLAIHCGGGAAGWEVVLVEEEAAGEGGSRVVEVATAPGAALAAAGVGSPTPDGGWAWHAGCRW
jgi:hypothetical protein